MLFKYGGSVFNGVSGVSVLTVGVILKEYFFFL
jgi:hypothetical protein